ncbi:Imm1 family immunity protein [Kitasatospora sp. NPDC088351]|uniref:Imm1 family immunity protein n=1 Tax=Kitasatospora sp. NPDC088351 TaxID=3155180 RepID=UPI00343D6AEC
MVLTVLIGDERHYGETQDDADRLISKVMEILQSGRNAWLSIDGHRRDRDGHSDNHLVVSLNRETGYGGIVWFVSEKYPKRGGIYESVWVSDNTTPPAIDPKVISDLSHPVFMEPASVFPLPDVRKILEEFYRTGTGDRPTCINWVKGHMNGERVERKSDANPAEDSFTGAEALLDDLMKLIESGDIPRD